MISFAQVDKEAIRRKIKDHFPEVKECYSNSLKEKPELQGKVVVNFDVDDTGSVKNAKTDEVKSTLKDEKFNSCLTEKMQAWKFPAPPKGQIANISYPFIFTKGTK